MRDRNAATLTCGRRPCGCNPMRVRQLADAVLDVAGPELADDATLLVVDWYGDHGRPRRTNAGADPRRTSPPLAG